MMGEEGGIAGHGSWSMSWRGGLVRRAASGRPPRAEIGGGGLAGGARGRPRVRGAGSCAGCACSGSGGECARRRSHDERDDSQRSEVDLEGLLEARDVLGDLEEAEEADEPEHAEEAKEGELLDGVARE